MADNHVTATCLDNHLRRDFPGKRAFFFPEDVLSADTDVRAARALHRHSECGVRRCNDNVAVFCAGDQGHERGEERPRLALRLEHLPVSGNDATSLRCAHYLLVSASTPGSLRPPRNSREAPPPVEMCEILLATPDWCTAATESPPPMMEVAPAVVAAATALATSSVPFANAGISKTPMGPFHTMVLALPISATYAAIVFGPMSKPIWSSGVAVTSQVVALASGFNSG